MEDFPSPPTLPADRSLASVPFLAGLSSAALAKVTTHLATRTHPANQALLLENDWGNSVYFLQQGWVKIRTYNLEGKEVTLNILGTGELFGEMAPLLQSPRSADVITLTAVVVSHLPAQDFIALVQSEPQAGLRLAQLMAQRLRQTNRRLRVREADSVAKVVDILMFLAEGQGKLQGTGIVIPNLPHRELSSLSGLARETVTRALSRLRKKGLIVADPDRDTLYIPDRLALEKMIL